MLTSIGEYTRAWGVRVNLSGRDVELRHWQAKVRRRLYRTGTGAASMDTIVWEVRDDNGGLPGNTVLAWGSHPFTENSALKEDRDITVGFHYTGLESVILEKTKYYWFILRTNDNGINKRYVLDWLQTTGTGQTKAYYHETNGWTSVATGNNLDILVYDQQAGDVWDLLLDGEGFMTVDHHRSTVTNMVQSGIMATRGGQQKHSQFRYPYSSFGQDSFHHGIGQLTQEDVDKYKFGSQVDTRREGQVVLGPMSLLTRRTEAADPHNTPTSDSEFSFPTLPHPTTTLNTKYVAYGTQFTWPASGGSATLDAVGLWVRRLAVSPTTQLFVEIYGDNANFPDTLLDSREWTGEVGQQWQFKGLPLSSSVAMTPSTKYWVVVRVQESGGGVPDTDEAEWAFQAKKTATGVTARYNGSSWEAGTVELYFITNPPTQAALDSNAKVAGILEYNNNVWAFANTKAFRWSGSTWDTVHNLTAEGMSQPATSFVSFAGYLFVSQGLSTYFRSNDGVTWTSHTAPAAVDRFWVALGFLWLSSNDHRIYKSNDGITWSAAIEVGGPTSTISSLLAWRDAVHVIRTDGKVYYLDENDLAIFRFDVGGVQDALSESAVWSDMLFIPTLSGLIRWSNALVQIIQPDFSAGIPPKFRGKVTALAPTVMELFVAVSPNEDDGYFTVYSYNGVGWTPLVRTLRTKATAPARPQRVYKMLAQPITNGTRLWVAEDNMVQYMDIYDNPFENTYATFSPEGWLTTSWWDGGVADAQKYFYRMRVVADNIVNATYETRIHVYYGLNGESDWYFLGRINASRDTLAFPADTYGTSIRFMFVLETSTPSQTLRIRYYNVEAVIRAVPGYIHTYRIHLAWPMHDMKGVRREDRTAQEMETQLRNMAASNVPIVVSDPFHTYLGMITALSESGWGVTREGTMRARWEKIATVSIVEV